MQETVAYAVGRAVAESGVRHCFGVVGSGNFHVTNALIDAGVGYVAARHECGAVAMADAAARVSGELAVATVHSGPGLGNAVTAIAEAAKSRTPLLVLAGDAANGALRSNFAMDQRAVAEGVAATVERLYRPDTALADVRRAVETAVRDRRTVVLNMPLDVQAARSPEGSASGGQRPGPQRLPHPNPADIEELAGLLARAERPLLLAGRGAVLSGAADAIRVLGEHVGALLATSACGHGSFVDDPWCLGMAGGFSSPAGVELISSSDLLIGFGATWTQWTTRHGRLVHPNATLVQVDVDPARLGTERRVDLAVLGDATAVAEALHAALGDRRRGWRTPDIADIIRTKSNDASPYAEISEPDHIDPRTLTREIDRIVPAERTVVLDSGHFIAWPTRYLRVPDAQGWVFAQAFQSIGLGLGNAIGAAAARPDRLTLLLAGDGGFHMGIAELETAVRLGQRTLVVVYNDAAYGAEVHHFGPGGHSTKSVEFPDTDIAAIARGFGAQAATVRRTADLDPVRAWVGAGADGVFVVDAKVTPGLVVDWLEEAFRGER